MKGSPQWWWLMMPGGGGWCECPGLFTSCLDYDPFVQVDGRPCLVTSAYSVSDFH